jgi:hypothetical protein
MDGPGYIVAMGPNGRSAYLPMFGEEPPRAEPDGSERILHVGYVAGDDWRRGLRPEIGRLGSSSSHLCWAGLFNGLGAEGAARELLSAMRVVPWTVVLVHAHRKGGVPASLLRGMREAADPGCVFAAWCGDVEADASEERSRPWMVELAQALDLFLFDDCTEPLRLVQEGACDTGYLPCGYDPAEFSYSDTGMERECVLFTGSWRPGERADLVEGLSVVLGDQVVAYGKGWVERGVVPGARPPVPRKDAAHLYGTAMLTLCQSMHDGGPSPLDRYASDRLRRVMAAGGVALVRGFPGMDGLGLVHGENCLVWSSEQELVALCVEWMGKGREADRERVRRAAAAHAMSRWTWRHHAERLLSLVREHRMLGGPG